LFCVAYGCFGETWGLTGSLWHGERNAVGGAIAKLSQSESEEVAKTTWTAELNQQERIVACRDENNHWVVLTQAA
jgi:hypothetical protein